jgi:hypothetical protein
MGHTLDRSTDCRLTIAFARSLSVVEHASPRPSAPLAVAIERLFADPNSS